MGGGGRETCLVYVPPSSAKDLHEDIVETRERHSTNKVNNKDLEGRSKERKNERESKKLDRYLLLQLRIRY